MVEFNEAILFESYKDIFKTCMKDGYPVPFLISSYDIPNEYLFTNGELDKLLDNLTDANREKLDDAYQNRRAKEIDIFRNVKGKKKIIEKINKYYNKELSDFINEYPKYKEII